MREALHDILFEPIKLGPVTAKNRFYQVPHCSGMGWLQPATLAAMRGMKAAGGWGVVCTEYCSIHPSSDDGAFPHAHLWDHDDIRAHRRMTDAVHEHGALAGVELWHGGGRSGNLASRLPPLEPTGGPAGVPHNIGVMQSRTMDKADIRAFRKRQRDAAKRAIEAGFDIVYVYATHGYLAEQFLNPATNRRTDEYGGSLENRIRIVRELIEETLETVSGKCAVATRFTVDLNEPETSKAFKLIADLPDYWDITVDDYGVEMGVSRFVKEAALEASVAHAKSMTTKPVVAVGRFTSPDTMAQVIRNGTQDMIGAARPSIADPFIPTKIEEGRPEDIRECIGCNICYAHDSMGVSLRCTQNPTMGEEFRRGWHPERVPPTASTEQVLVVGAGPAGLEAARALGERGYAVLLAEASRDLGGRVVAEAQLPGLNEWIRVRDWRVGQIEKNANIETYRESPMTAETILEVGAAHVMLATGAAWKTDGIGHQRSTPIDTTTDATIVSVDSLLDDADLPAGHAVIYDDDHYYIGSVLSLALREQGHPVTLVTPGGRAGQASSLTAEMWQSNAALIEAGVTIVTNHSVVRVAGDHVTLACIFSGKTRELAADWVVPITRREPNDQLFHDLTSHDNAPSVIQIGDCFVPGIIAAAVYSGYQAAVELGEDPAPPKMDRQL
tara:strand:+ start:503 stop:2512 length:2010 start_codon:yes stop_codon:yes gene_type:complete